MRKYPGTTDFETIRNRIVPSYAQSDTGDVRIVYPDSASDQDDTASPDARFSRTSMADKLNDTLNQRGEHLPGKTSRQCTPEQLAAMKHVGLSVETPSLKERAQALWKDAGKKLPQGIRDMTYNEAERFVMSAIDIAGQFASK